MLNRDSSGLRILNIAVEEKSWDILSELKIRDSEFFGDSEIVLKYLRQYQKDSDDFPPKDFLEEETGVEFPKPVTRDAAKKNYKRNRKTKTIKRIVEPAAKAANNGDPDTAEKILVDGLAKLQDKNEVKSFKESAKERLDKFISDVNKPLQGVYPPFETWREYTNLLVNGTTTVIAGVSSSGKSWLSCYTACHAAFAQGKKVLLISKENTESSMNMRLDALYHTLEFNSLRDQIMDMRAIERWENQLPELKSQEGDIYVVGTTEVKSVADIYQLVQMKKPDLVIVDGAYKLSSTDFKDSSQLIQDFCDFAALSNIPWIMTIQLNIEANDIKGFREVGMKARGNKNWFNDVDNSLAITQNAELEMLGNVIRCQIVKAREKGDTTGLKREFYLQMDMTMMTIKEFSFDDYEDDEILNSTF